MDAARKFPPRFTADQEGRTEEVSLDAQDYLRLLVRGNITDPEQWPPESRQGAALLARIRQIEAECIARLGRFDWEQLDPDLQDEYDNARIDLDRVIDPSTETYTLDEVAAELGIKLP